MKVSYPYLEYLYEKKRLQTLKEQSQQLAHQIDQTTQDLKELERLQSLDALNAGSGSRSRQGLLIAKAPEQPWGNYLFFLVLVLLLIVTGVSL
ncbi:MAG: hypothetical protein ACFB0G_10720 [Leptolyngbyaceae cyanobacterium]